MGFYLRKENTRMLQQEPLARTSGPKGLISPIF
jgi:hypothetical protein